MAVMKKRRKLRLDNIFIFVSLMMLFVLVGIYVNNNFVEHVSLNDDNELIQEENKQEEEPKEEIYTASMIMAGDNLIHQSLFKDAAISGGGYDFRKMYELIKPIVSSYDIAYYNQETTLGGKELGLYGYPRFNSPYEVGDAMIDAGFNLVSLATNHTIDRGEKAIINSLNYWKGKDDVLTSGSYSSFSERDEIRVREVNNISYTMLNYTYGTNGLAVPSGKEYLVNVWPCSGNDPGKDSKYQAYKEQVKKDVEAVRDSVDILMVAMHWGVEYTHEPTVYEKDMAEYLASLGVDIIIGTHPHVVQPVTFIDNTLVIYSLGNLISAQYQNKDSCKNYKCMVGLMTSLEITKVVKGEEVSISIGNVDNELIYTYYNNFRKFKVVPFSSVEIGNYLSNYKSIYEKYKEVVQRYDSNMHVRELSGTV